LPQLLPQNAASFTVRRQVMHWFALNDSDRDRYRPDNFPVFYWQLPRRQSIYGFPWIGSGEPAIKLATEQYDSATRVGAVDRDVQDGEAQTTYAEYIVGFFPGVSNRVVRSAVCLYTCVDDARFIIDTLPGAPRVIVASPCSGHGFKHSAAIGEALADLTEQGKSAKYSLEGFGFAAATNGNGHK